MVSRAVFPNKSVLDGASVHCSIHPLQIETNLFPSEDREPKYTTEVTQMETVVNMDMQLVFPSAASPSTNACTHSSAEYSLISDGAVPEQCIGVAHDKKCITIYIIKLPYKTCMIFI